jgi:ABC-type transport system involved in multi-copper enzyme maturation permease subunit
MSAATPADAAPGVLSLGRWRLPRAELLKVRKRRWLVITTALLTIGAVALILLILALLHVFNPAHHGPAGGSDNFRGSVEFMSQLTAVVAAVLVGSYSATSDVDSGVFRELVVTGRSRTHLYLARVPGGLIVLWVLAGIAYLIAAMSAVWLAGSDPQPSLRILVETGLWLELSAAVAFSLALGLGSLIGSRAATITVLLGWLLIVQPVLSGIGSLGNAGREWLARAALVRLAPIQIGNHADRVPMSLGVALVVIAAWVAVPLAAGLWRTRTRDA